ncbi:MAG: PP2C family protein-serine/threonine phosphatase, partial [Planctomycetaceae bacterium]
CLPIESQTGPIGTLWLYDRRFKAIDTLPVDLLRGFAARIADVFDRIVLLQDAEKCDRITRELDVIASTTEDIRDLEASYPGCDIALRCLSRLEVGGDLCEIVAYDQYRTVFVIGDASGDSIPAAMVMTATRGAVHALLQTCRNRNQIPVPHEFVEELNRALLHVTAAQQFITLLFGVFDSRTGTLQYTNAGHCPPLHVRSETVTAMEAHGLLLGVLDEATYCTAELKLLPDDSLILFSDGIIEARDENECMFQNQGIIDALAEQPCETAAATLHSIWSEYELHTGGRNLDDRTLMVIQGTDSAAAVPSANAPAMRSRSGTALCH